MAIISITSNNFSNLVLKSDKPTLVLFWAVGSPHNGTWDRLLHALDDEKGASVGICKVSVNYAPHIAMRFRIATYPTLALFLKGQMVGTVSGSATMDKIDSLMAHIGAEDNSPEA